jgi:hypothetical protein
VVENARHHLCLNVVVTRAESVRRASDARCRSPATIGRNGPLNVGDDVDGERGTSW